MNTFRVEVDPLAGEIDLDDNIFFFTGTASEENRHYEVRAVLFGLGSTICDQDKPCEIDLWMANDGTEVISNPKLSYGVFDEDGVLLQSQRTPFTLVHGQGDILQFIFEPFSLSAGIHTLTGIGDYLNEYEERDETNNTVLGTITMNAADPPLPEPIHDVAVLGLSVPDVEQGDVGKVTAVLKNIGDQDEATVKINVEVDGQSMPVIKISLNAGETKQFNRDFPTGLLSEGTHSIKVELGMPLDRDLSNNSMIVDFDVIVTPPPPDPEPPIDTTAPEVMFTNPNDGDIVRGKITFRVSAIDDESGVKFVRLTIDGKVKGDDTNAPYSWVWQSSKPGNHIIGALACDNVGNCSTDTILVNVKKGKG